MRDLKSTTGDEILVEIHQNTTPPIVKRWATDTTLFNRTPVSPSSVATSAASSPNFVSGDTPQASESESIVTTPSSKRRKSRNGDDKNICRKCFVSYGSATDNQYDSIWINCANKKCDYWVHGYCINLVVREGKEEEFDDLVKFYCPSHNPHVLPRRARKK